MTSPKTPKIKAATEKQLHSSIADWINLQFPNVIFLSDPSGMRLSMGLRLEAKRKRCARYKIPDLIILHPNKQIGLNGLCLELKKQGEKIYKRDGSWINEHVEEQAKTLARLKEIGYAACFAIGFDEAVEIIQDYLKQ